MRSFLSARSVSSAVVMAAAVGCAGVAHAQKPSPVVLEGADRGVLDAIAATLPEREPPETLFDAERLAEEAALRAETWLRSEGYYAGVADPQAADNPPSARVKITLGERFTFAAPTVRFDGGRLDDRTEAGVRVALQQGAAGKPARAEDVLGAEKTILRLLQDSGYAEAKTLTRGAIVDHETGLMQVGYAFDIGAPVRLGHVRVEPPGALKDEFVEDLKTWRAGDLYAERKLVDLRRDLTSTGAFTRAQVSLAPEADESGQRDVIVRLEEMKPRTIALGAAYSTTEGAGVEGSWTRRNIYGRADALTLFASVAELEQRAGAQWFRPHAAGRGRGQRFGIEALHENVDPFDRSAIVLSAAIEAEPNVKFAATYGASLAYNVYSESAGVDNALIVSTFYDLRQDRSDDRLDPRKGSVLEARVEPSVSLGDAATAFVRTTGAAKYYVSPGAADRTTLAARLTLGWAQPVAGTADDLPLDRRFYAGGGGSVRGYEYRSIYPAATVTTDPPGGQGLIETSLEARFRATQKIGAVLFLDGGSAFNDLDQARDVRWGAGVGARYNLGFAPLRFDIAMPLDKRESDPDFAFYVSLGQAF